MEIPLQILERKFKYLKVIFGFELKRILSGQFCHELVSGHENDVRQQEIV
jgi:hypothetical protein